MAFKFRFVKSWLWDISQKIIGADDAKQQLHLWAIQPKPTDRILDLGCSTGNTSEIFKIFDYTGVDIDNQVIDFANYKFRNYPNMKFIGMNILDFTYNKKFDYILFGSAGHHIEENLLIQILIKLKSLLNENGFIALIDPIIKSGDGWLMKFERKIDQGNYFKTREQYLDIFKQSGLHLVEETDHEVKGMIINYKNFVVFKLR